MSLLIAPHGGVLIDRIASAEEARELEARAPELPRVQLDERQLSDFEMIACGALSPLTGFMTSEDYRSVVDAKHLMSGLPWTVPVTLDVDDASAGAAAPGGEIALYDDDGLVGVMTVEDRFSYDKRQEAINVFRTRDAAHPGVAAVYAQGETLLGGAVTALRLPRHGDFAQYRLTPSQTRGEFDRRGWRTVVGFQTRNPIHRAHEYLQKCALEMVDGLLVHPLVGATKSDDIPADVRMRCYEVLLEKYYPAARVVLSVNPAHMRYAGPSEAIFHALIRKNYGCSHFIVGRDHAGVGSYYGTYDAQTIFDEFDAEALGIVPLKFEHAFFCRACGGMGSTKVCPHSAEEHVFLSGTRVREMLQQGQLPPVEFTRPEVAEVLRAAVRAAS